MDNIFSAFLAVYTNQLARDYTGKNAGKVWYISPKNRIFFQNEYFLLKFDKKIRFL